MKHLFVFVTVLFSLLLFSSCNKDEDSSPQKTKLSHLPLKTGNYWVYEHFKIDNFGNEEKLTTIDSVVITRDTIINDMKYYVVEGNYIDKRFRILDILRDSSGYLVNDKGQIKFSEDNFSDILLVQNTTFGDSTYATVYYKMEKQDDPITVPAGTFNDILNYKGTAKFYGNNDPFYKDKNTYYAKDVGIILDTYYWISKAKKYKYERRLVRYHISD